MSKELVIASNRHETKVAILEDDQLVEVYFQRSNEYSLAGSIHKGRVTRVLPGMQSAFVDLGLERDTFLYVSDFFEEHGDEDIDTVTEDKGNRRERGPNEGRRDRNERLPVMVRPIEVQTVPELAAPNPEPEEIVSPTAEPVVTAQTAAPSESSTFRPDNRQDNNDRNRRGRRSRRRRTRGGGFPENKYAQPSAITAEPVGEAEAEADEEPERTSPIILPGESLAKYRHSGGRLQEREEQPEIPSASGTAEVARFEAEELAPFEEPPVDERAEELEIADKVLSHHYNEPPLVEEQKIADVRNDQPVSPFLVGDIEEEPDREEMVQSAELREPAPVEALRLNLGEPDKFVSHSPDLDEAGDDDGVSAAEFAEDEMAQAAELEEEDALDAVPFEGADLEDSASGEEIEGITDENAPPETRTEGDREQGGRPMQRGSRRMRRRRGGNRFGNQSRGEQPPPREEIAGPLQAAAAGSAAGVALRTEPRREAVEARGDKPERILPSISDLLKAGQELIVQIAKEPLGQKGARITSHVALPGRYVVFMPSVSHLGVSRKVESEEERQRLKRILQAHRVGATGGFIVRTAGEGVPEDEIAADMDFLYKLWLDIKQKAEKKPAPLLLHYDLDIVQRILRDQVTEDFKAIWVDNEEMYEGVLSFVQRFQPTLVGRVKMYTREAPIFDAFSITQELEKALRPKVWLKSGGYIVINQTEALVAIDINTGKYVGKSNRLEDTIVKTNLEAVKEIVRQIRLRDLGGIIVVDFIDMDERKNRQRVMQALEEAMQADKAPNKILQFNDFGLVAITRKRVKQSLERTLCAPCPYCEGAGYVKSVQTIIGEILAEAQKIRKALDRHDVLLRVHPEVAKVLKSSDNRFLEELEEILSRPVLVKGDPTLHHEKFDLG